MFQNIVENASFDKKERQVSDSSLITFVIFVQIFVVSSLNQLLNFEILKSIKILKKKNKKRSKRIVKDAQRMILILIISEKNL